MVSRRAIGGRRFTFEEVVRGLGFELGLGTGLELVVVDGMGLVFDRLSLRAGAMDEGEERD